MNIILIGYRCCGKTSIGRELAFRLGVPFYDTDEIIEDQTGRTVQEIVAKGGWPAFRTLERRTIGRLAKETDSVIALGGGAVVDPANMEALRPAGCFVWLTADESTIVARMTQDGKTDAQRPPLGGGDSASEVSRVLRERMPIYRAAAQLVLDTTDMGLDETVEEICKYFKKG